MLIVLGLVVVATASYARALLPIHVFVGILFLGPLAVMIGSTGYRFLSYYMGSPAFAVRGKPVLGLRLIAPLLLVTTFLVVASGLALLVTGPRLLVVHVFSAIAWLPLIAIHALAHERRVPRLIADDWTWDRPAPPSGRVRRLVVSLAALTVGTLGAILSLPVATSFFAWSKTIAFGPGPFVVGVMVAILALLATRPLRWR